MSILVKNFYKKVTGGLVKFLLRKLKSLYWKLRYLFWKLKFSLFAFFRLKNVTSRYNIKLVSNYSDLTFRYYFFANYGFYYSNYLASITSKFLFLDIGANQGLYSIIAAKNPCCKKVISFEPISSTHQFLKENIEINGVGYKCISYKKAIDNVSGIKKIGFDSSHSGGTSLVLEKKDAAIFETVEIVDYSFLENVFQELNDDIFLKVDVEGHELTVLNEIFKCEKSKLICSIFYEVDTRWVEPSTIRKLLQDKGFREFQKIGTDDNHYDVLATK